jgi:hypothetical protein
MPQNQAQDQAQNPPAPAASETHLNRYPIFSPGLTRAPLSIQDKFQIYTHKAYCPPAVILPAFGAGSGMLNPPSKYPKEWKDGAGAFGRNYGYRLADHTSRLTGQFLTGTLLHEDPRYLRRPVPIPSAGPYMLLHSLSSIRRTPAEPPSRPAISLRQLLAGSLEWGSFRMATTTLRTRSNTWRASSCRLGLGMSSLSSNPNGDPGPRNYAFPKSCRVGGSQNTAPSVVVGYSSRQGLDMRQLWLQSLA